ncbi:MAG TPA: sialidase family protein [Candidatus Hydrogenedentes bacterium]|jgi:hypothetical protein|nr:sialidase family protein [Candidatus Hydrogenedentota bacterium]HPJ99300.1 sialidase family protein [Candidatus Hydrogenedentota bacterium]
MHRRAFIQSLTLTPMLAGARAESELRAVEPPPLVANSYVKVYESPDATQIYSYSPGLAVLPSGRLVATLDLGGPAFAGKEGPDGYRGRIYTSDDRGQTWTLRASTPMMHARPFAAGEAVYVLGHHNDLGIVRSNDDGTTWSEASWLTQGQRWHQAPCNVHYTNGRIYLVMERDTDPDYPMWPVSVFAPVLMAANVNDDLTSRAAWIFSNELSYREIIAAVGPPHLLGIPFHTPGNTVADTARVRRPMADPGWLETNVVQFVDPNHVWFDPEGRTFHLWMRAHTGSTNLAAIAKAVESGDGKITVSLENAPSGAPMMYVPCPGGHMKFHILYDEPTKLFWLLSSQTTDSMTRPDRLPDDRFDLPNNERHRLTLHFSKNCVDWCFAARVAQTNAYGQARHYASMVIQDDDLHVLSRSGDARARSAHDGNIITFHTVRDFRNLVY